MNDYAVLIGGENFLLAEEESDGQRIRKRDFVVWRCVSAENEASAERIALQRVRDDPDLNERVRNAPDDPPALTVKEMRVGFGDLNPRVTGGGFIFWDAEDRDEPPLRRWWSTFTSRFQRKSR